MSNEGGGILNQGIAPTSPEVSARMSRVRTTGTAPELTLRRLLHRLGVRYRVHYPVVGRRRRTVDIAFPRQRLAVFIDGCFWHACPAHRSVPRANNHFWTEKLAQNRVRDLETNEILIDNGWTVLRFWEHEDSQTCLASVVTALHRLGHRSAGPLSQCSRTSHDG